MDTSNNSKIAKNTLFLYLRMLISIAVNFYSVRLLWHALGIYDYGIYNVVGGIVMLFSFINSSMVGSSQRYMAYAIGQKDEELLNKTFCLATKVHTILAVIIVILAETIGLWFLNYKMQIPTGRLIAANWVYQCSIFAFVLNVLSVPYNASIVAHEHMKIYGYFGIIEVFLKLFIVLIIVIIPFDRLITYALLVALTSLIMRIAYGVYCRHHFKECIFHNYRDKKLLASMLGFAKWTFIGVMGITIRNQGINLVINLFFNVAVNAANGIANQIINVINGFSSNFTMALNPQIIKRYSYGDISSMMNLVSKGCKYSLMLMSFIVIPLIIVAEPAIKIWLGSVAPYTVGFLQLGLIIALIESVVSPITTAIQATGNIRNFQIYISIIMIICLPVSCLFLNIYHSPYIGMYVMFVSGIIAILIRLYLLHSLIRFSYRHFLSTVFLRPIPSICLSFIICWYLNRFYSDGLIGITLFCLTSLIIISVFNYSIGLTKLEKATVSSKITEYINNKIKINRR